MVLAYYSTLGFAFVLGSCIGSFLNVVIYRIPAGESIVSPGSRCPSCGVAIRWYQNVPILSWMLLRGRCAACGSAIASRYPMVEGLTGGLFALVLYHFGLTWGTPVYWLFVAALVAITFIDLDHQIIPDVISLPGVVVGFSCSFLLPWLNWTDSLIGLVTGYGSLWIIATGYHLLTGREGMGGGDLKLLAMIGAFLGWKAILPVIFFSSLVGTAIAVPLALRKGEGRGLAIPFGPFLAAGALFYLFWGPQLIGWYFSLFLHNP